MFSDIPPLSNFETKKLPDLFPIPYQMHHSIATNDQYVSLGETRRDETHCIFHYTLRGHGEVLYRGVWHKTNPGEGFFNIINEEGSGYRYPKSGSEPWEFIVICFDGKNTRETVGELLEDRVIYTVRTPEAFCSICKRLLRNTDGDIFLTFFSRLVAMMHDSNTPDGHNWIYTEFKHIVERDLLKNPTIATIAAELGISREHLQREYFRQTGNTPAKYLGDRRFEYLCYLLTTDASDAEIADTMNFSSIASMNSFFKRSAGTTPQRFRKNGYFAL